MIHEIVPPMIAPPHPRILIFYSNPSDSDRLRLDKEHRAIDELLRARGLPPETVRRMHAASVSDFARAVRDAPYEIIQFSGHGSENGIYLERGHVDAGIMVDPKQLAAILRPAAPNLRAAMFISCFSASSAPELYDVAPYIVTIAGPAADAAAVEFVSAFYDSYFADTSVERAFVEGTVRLEITPDLGELSPVISRRAMHSRPGRLVVQAFPGLRRDSVLIDMTDAQADLLALGIPTDRFLATLTRKIRIHAWAFEQPREQAILSIGQFFGIFSWENASDVVVCHRVLRVRDDLDGETCRVWSSLVLCYNDLASARYRSAAAPASPVNERHLKKALLGLHSAAERFLEGIDGQRVRDLVPDHFKVARSLMISNLDMVTRKLDDEDLAGCVAYLEASLSAVHDLLDALTGAVSEARLISR